VLFYLSIVMLGPEKARLAELVRWKRLGRVVECGTAIGYSGLWIACERLAPSTLKRLVATVSIPALGGENCNRVHRGSPSGSDAVNAPRHQARKALQHRNPSASGICAASVGRASLLRLERDAGTEQRSSQTKGAR